MTLTAPRPVRPGWSARLALMTIRLKEAYAYRVDILVWLINPALQLVLLATVWRAVYAGREVVDGVPLSTMTGYVGLAALHSLVMREDTVSWVEKRVRSGVIAMDLLRPVPLTQQVVGNQLAQLVGKIPMVALVLPVAALAAGIPSPAALGPYLLAALLGWLVNCGVFLLVSAVAFWTLEMGGMTFFFYIITGFLSGALVPLWVMPDWLQFVLQLLPMQATVYTPVAVYLGQLSGPALWQAVAVQAGWVVLLGGAAAVVWRRAVRRVVVQGG